MAVDACAVVKARFEEDGAFADTAGRSETLSGLHNQLGAGASSNLGRRKVHGLSMSASGRRHCKTTSGK